MSEPRTEAGRAFLASIDGRTTLHDIRMAVLAIEAEAVRDDEPVRLQVASMGGPENIRLPIEGNVREQGAGHRWSLLEDEDGAPYPEDVQQAFQSRMAQPDPDVGLPSVEALAAALHDAWIGCNQLDQGPTDQLHITDAEKIRASLILGPVAARSTSEDRT